MADFVATFVTHYDAMQFKRGLDRRGVKGQMAPVPRWLSSSCGTCVRFSAAEEDISSRPTADLEMLVLAAEEPRVVLDNR